MSYALGSSAQEFPVPRPAYELKAELFKSLGHPARIRVLEVLREGPASVGDISEQVGVGGSTLSQHLTTLRRLGLVTATRDGTAMVYRVNDPRVFDLLAVGRAILTTELESSREVLDDLESMTFDVPTT